LGYHLDRLADRGDPVWDDSRDILIS